jgi:sugar lactone lactonase YvrE
MLTFVSLLSLLACTGEPEETVCTEAPGNICTWAGTGVAGLGGEGTPALETNLYLPIDMSWGPDGDAYLLDWNNHRIRRVTPDGGVVTIAGTGELGDGPVGPAVDTRFNHPSNLAWDSQGRMLIAAWHNSRVMRIDMSTGILEFVAGDGTRSFAGDGGDPAVAKLDLPSGVVVDSRDQIYISDQANQRIRCIDTTNVIDTVAGNGTPGYAGDGGAATDAELHASVGQAAAPANRMALSPDGARLYFTDTGNHVVRFLDIAAGTMNAFAGTGVAGASGDGGPAATATLSGPTDLAVGPDGELFVADTGNSCVRRIDPDGVISTAVGVCGQLGYEGDGGAAEDALLNQPYGVELDADGNLYVSDTYNQVVRVVYR